MKGLATLIRLHRLKLTEKQRRLNELQAVARDFVNQIAALDRAARDEAGKAAGSPETAHTLGSFIQAQAARRRTLEASLADVEREMAGIRETVAAAFRELKRYELIEAQRAAEVRQVRERRERRSEDEIGMQMHRRREQAAGG